MQLSGAQTFLSVKVAATLQLETSGEGLASFCSIIERSVGWPCPPQKRAIRTQTGMSVLHSAAATLHFPSLNLSVSLCDSVTLCGTIFFHA